MFFNQKTAGLSDEGLKTPLESYILSRQKELILDLVAPRAGERVLDIGCGTGSLLETLVIPPSTVHEPPIRSSRASSSSNAAEAEGEDEDEDRELFILVRPPFNLFHLIISHPTLPLHPSPTAIRCT